METKINLKCVMSLLLICFISTVFAQDEKEFPLGYLIYEEYSNNGVDMAITRYQDLKAEKSDQYPWDDRQLNAAGYRIMNEDGDMEAAGKIFRLNMEEYPQAANPYDSYGDYLVKKGNEKEAREYFEKSMAISKNSEVEWEKNVLYPITASKMAKLDKKDKRMDFLLGDWQIDAIVYEDGKETQKMKTSDKIKFDEPTNSIYLHHFDDQNESMGVRIITYDAIDDEFDVAYFNNDRLRGIEVSHMKMKDLGNNKLEFMDSFTEREGQEMFLKHEIEKISDNEINWVIFEKNDKDDWQRVYAMNMKK
ncbi:tetratricopeptide repeat protein [Salinimicrobium flavum]|uniref:Tetratricopeptide repeat protein n=1 Tax=Salinimicrobium flavum TaxID=1737065 RepID=A0ABW5ISC0_9FLAO